MVSILLAALLILFAGPQDLFAERSLQGAHHRIDIRSGTHSRSPDRRGRDERSRHPAHDRRSRFRPPVSVPLPPGGAPGKPVHPVYPGYHPGRPGHGRPGYWWPASTTVVREVQPIIIVNQPPPAAPPPPEPEKVWVPPVMDTRTEPGYWDYGVKKVWMGDHWRYEQDHSERKWVPASQVTYVKQEGYWKPVE